MFMCSSLSVADMEETFAEYKEWVGGLVDPEVEKAFNRALAMLEKVKPYEDELLAKHVSSFLTVIFHFELIAQNQDGLPLVVGHHMMSLLVFILGVFAFLVKRLSGNSFDRNLKDNMSGQ